MRARVVALLAIVGATFVVGCSDDAQSCDGMQARLDALKNRAVDTDDAVAFAQNAVDQVELTREMAGVGCFAPITAP